jgi:hypothetical protein
VTSDMDKYLSHAIRLYTGWDVSSIPESDADAVVQEYGEVLGAELLMNLRRVLKEVDEMSPLDSETPLQTTARIRPAIIRDHPGLEPPTVQALVWIYDFGRK